MTNATKIETIAAAIAAMDPVAVKAQGVSTHVEVSVFPVETIAAWLTYGTRRAFQDHVNSVAHKLRGDDKEVDADAILEAYSERAMNGDITTRAGGAASASDPLDVYRKAIIRKLMAAPENADVKAEYEAIDSKDRKARDEYLLAMAAKHAIKVDVIAKRMKAQADKVEAELDGIDFEA